MNRGLARLAFRRSFPVTWTVLALLLTALVAALARAVDVSALDALPLGLDAERVHRSLARQTVWTGLLLVWMPALLVLAAGTVPRWRERERAWLAPAALSRGALLSSAWCGGALAAAVVLLGCAVVSEAAAGEGPPGRQLVGKLSTPRVLLMEGDGPREWECTVPGAVRGLRAMLTSTAGGAVPAVRFSVRRAGGEWRAVERRIGGRTSCEIELPPGAGPVVLRLERLGPGAGVALVGDVAATASAASERLASVAVALRCWLALCAWSALALGLGAWFSAPTAAAGTLAIAVATWMAESAPAWLPGRDLGAALVAVGEGLVPAWPTLPALGAAAACVVLGLGLGAAGLRRWRRG